MSLSKSWKILSLVAMLALVFSGCAGSKGGSSGGDEGGSYSSEEGGSGSEGSSGEGGAKPAAPKEDIDEDKLKDAQKDAMESEKENHELRRQIFEAKNKLGLPVEQAAEE
jgi:hypothetical protein